MHLIKAILKFIKINKVSRYFKNLFFQQIQNLEFFLFLFFELAEYFFEQIDYLDRPEFYQEGEKEFKAALTQSMQKYGMKDPVYCWANGKAYGNMIKVIVGNNRMIIAKELGIKMIPAVITNFKADTLPIEGRILNTDAEIRELKQEKIILTNLCKDLKREMKSIKADSLLKQDYFLDLSA